jgi:addiction module HigA family antidote
MAKRTPKYEAFPPGDLIRRELEHRGWTQGDLARIMGRPLQIVNQIINGSKAITARTARELEAALGPEAQFWMNLETSWRLYIEAEADPQITVRARQSSRRKTSKKTAEFGDFFSVVGMTGNAKKRKIKSTK